MLVLQEMRGHRPFSGQRCSERPTRQSMTTGDVMMRTAIDDHAHLVQVSMHDVPRCWFAGAPLEMSQLQVW